MLRKILKVDARKLTSFYIKYSIYSYSVLGIYLKNSWVSEYFNNDHTPSLFLN